MSERVEIWWVVFERVDWEPSPAPFPVEVKLPPGCVGFLPVFADRAAALEWAGGNDAAIHRVKRTFRDA